MVKAIYFTLSALSACAVLAVPTAYQRREASVDFGDILEERDDTASLQEREPFLPLIGLISNIGMKLGTSVLNNVIKTKMQNPKRRSNRRKRDLEAEDELELIAREDIDEMDEVVERELDVLGREMNDDDILGREVVDGLYLD